MLAAVTGALWVASVLFINPATGNTEASRWVSDNPYNNGLETCLSHLQSIANGLENGQMEVQNAACYITTPGMSDKTHEVIWYGAKDQKETGE